MQLYFSLIFGGCQGRLQTEPALRDTWLFDQVRRQWFNITVDPRTQMPPALWGHAGAVISITKALFFGGEQRTGTHTHTHTQHVHTKDS